MGWDVVYRNHMLEDVEGGDGVGESLGGAVVG